MTDASFIYKPVDTSNWKDLEKLFESRGGPHDCWCMVWRDMAEGKDRADKTHKKASLKSYVQEKVPIGLLCYVNEEPVAWCSIAPRESYRDLSGDHSLNKVWSLVCFFIKTAYRGQGLVKLLIQAALQYAKTNGAKYVEAYPVDPDSPSYRFMGFKPTFDKMGFEFKHKAGLRRNVMTIEL